jgi:F420-dependent oxidoreductase-like protein
MRIGLMMGVSREIGNDLPGITAFARQAEAMGFDNVWIAHTMGVDAMTALTVAGAGTARIRMGTAVVPTFPRHPVVMAQQALTTAVACGGRFELGIGLSHKMLIEDMYGISYAHPAAHMREYLEVLLPALRGEHVKHHGERYNVNIRVAVPGAAPMPVLVAALGPAMLKVAGELADGTITWMTGPRTLEQHIVPAIGAAAAAAGRPQPRVVAGLPVVLTTDVDAARKKIAEMLAIYGMLPSYRAMLDREGVAGAGDIAMVGDEAALRAGIARLRDVGVTDLDAAIMPLDAGALTRTRNFLATELRPA